ncbi:MAG: hypothetical protein ACYCSS_11130 [Sulfuriferula sp.]
MSQFKKLSTHILQASASMVGVCVMIISIVKLLHLGLSVGRLIDKMLALDNVLFLFSALLSYASMRNERLSYRLENLADALFMFGLIWMTAASLVLSFAIL